MPKGSTFSLTDIVLGNPNGDSGTLTLSRSNDVLLVESLENFRDLDYHFIAPIVVHGGEALKLDVKCDNSASTAASGASTTPPASTSSSPPPCTPAAYLAGFNTTSGGSKAQPASTKTARATSAKTAQAKQLEQGLMRRLAGGALAAMLLRPCTGSASAQNFFHGIVFTKGCTSPMNVGFPYTCAYSMRNLVDTAQGPDTLNVNGVTDRVQSFNGDLNSENMLGALQMVFSSPTVTCVGGSGLGTAASPYVGATSWTLPFGSKHRD